MNFLNKCPLICGCPQTDSSNAYKTQAVDENRSKRWKLSLQDAAYMCLSDPLDRQMKLKQKTKGVRALETLVKRIKRDAGVLEDEELCLLLRCCLYCLKYYSQKVDRGEYLMRHWMQIAQFCYINSAAYIPRHQIHIAVTSVIRFLHDEDKWHSCDFGIKVLKDLMQVVGEIHTEGVEEEILSVFINHMTPFCPGMSSITVPEYHFSRSLSFSINPDETDTSSTMRKNPLLDMSRVLHGVLAGCKFSDFGDVGWTALEILLTIYINVVNISESTDQDSRNNVLTKRMSREWNMTESALIGSLRNFLDDIISSDVRFKLHMECRPSITPSTNEETGKRMSQVSTSSSASSGGGDILSQTMIVVLECTIGDEVPQTARSQLLDMLINATRTPLGIRHFSSCLPEKLLNPLLEVARVDDSGSTLRSHKLLHHIMDRHSLRVHFVTPKIFKKDCDDFKTKYDPSDWDYLKLHRKNFYDTLYRNFLKQSKFLNNLEAFYCTLCLILVEVPCIYSARDIAELMVNIQDTVIGNPDILLRPPRVCAWIHSTVISVLSLIPAIHDLDELAKLVNEVVSRRAQVAPFLIPPLKARHTIGDITDFQEDLFFSHALVRRCFTNIKTIEESSKEEELMQRRFSETSGRKKSQVSEGRERKYSGTFTQFFSKTKHE